MKRKDDIEVTVNPKVLVWARESAGKTIEEVAEKLRTTPEVVKAWETGQKHPTLRTLERLTKLYKCCLAAFLLPKPPRKRRKRS